MDLTGKWCFGSDSEDFTGEYSTKEEAITAGKEEIEELLTVGVMYRATPYISADDVIEQIQHHMDEDHGESAEYYLDDVTKEQTEQLDIELNKVIDTWIERYGLQPNFYEVRDIEYIEE